MTAGVIVELARVGSSGINPLLAVGFIGTVIVSRKACTNTWFYVLASLAGLVICAGIVHVLRSPPIWHGHPYFPSGHEAFGASLATSIGWRFRNWPGVLAAVSVILLAPCLVYAGYHVWVDVVASLVVSPVVTIACHVLIRKRPQAAPPSAA